MTCRQFTLAAVFLLLVCGIAALAKKEETLDQLKARLATANPEQKVGLCIEIADRQLDSADELFKAGKVEEARAVVAEVIKFADQATDASTTSGKKMKHAEIEVRKMAHRLHDIKGTLNFDDQPPVQESIDHLEHLRTLLLTKMFGTDKPKQ